MYNLEKISILTGFVDKLIQMRDMDNNLTDEIVEGLIKESIDFSKAHYTDEEIDYARKEITYRYQIYADPGESILGNYDQENWYDDAKADIKPEAWTRYKNYLIDTKHFSPNIVSTLSNDTLDQKLMNYILDPKAEYPNPVLRRGLIIGDVQSGKTSTYIGFICKAADAGYKVFILLTGTIESLRKQTQERVEEGFIGIDMSDSKTGGKRVGVGLDCQKITSMSFTSRNSDFKGNSDKIAVALSDNNAVVFVIKKQKNVLTKLKDWLVTLNADPITGKIDVPMLLIDDEADNASINTSKSKEDPTTINRLIRELANVFTKSNYVGFTATPFANVFIDPETTEKMETQDLFPEDFIISLPTPSNYIGPNRIFAENGEFHSQLIYINDAGYEEEDGFSFYFKHKKEWEGDLPESLTDSIYTFYLANAIRDLRGDNNQHRSMLVNISRFVKVQKYTKSVIEDIHTKAYRSIKYNLSHDFIQSMQDPVLKRIYHNWESQYSKCEFKWDEIVDTLLNSIENIQIKIVNSSRESEKLEYPKNEALRVIAIGGLALSRGLTLEGLIISYFYRNTCTYDVLMQMGRWFGYRKGYEDLFRIWTHKSSARWYAEIAEATENLKYDMYNMRERNLRPRDFGIRVRNNSEELNITAYNKMRNSIDEIETNSYYGSLIETPYLHMNTDYQKNNFKAVKDLVNDLVNDGFDFSRQKMLDKNKKGHYIIQNIPKIKIVEFLRKMKISRFSSSFNINQIVDFLENDFDPSISLFDIAFMEGTETIDPDLIVDLCGRSIPKVIRNNCTIDSAADRLNIGNRGRLGGPSDGITGIVDYNHMSKEHIIALARETYKAMYKEDTGMDFSENKKYPSDIWFKYVENRKPLIIIYMVDINYDKEEQNQRKQIEDFKKAMGGIPAIGLAMGLPKNNFASCFKFTKYKANKVYNWFEQDEMYNEGDEE